MKDNQFLLLLNYRSTTHSNLLNENERIAAISLDNHSKVLFPTIDELVINITRLLTQLENELMKTFHFGFGRCFLTSVHVFFVL